MKRVVLLGLLLLSAPAWAQGDDLRVLKTLSLEALGNVTVTTATKREESLWRTASALYVITAADIRRAGVTRLPEALRLAPGVVVGRSDSNHWSVGIRGFGDGFSKSMLMLIDGRSVYTPLLGGVFLASQETLISDIERIEVIRGPGGVIWGANAMNGVINIITKKAKDTQGATATVGVGTVDQNITTARYGGQKGRLTYRGYGKTLFSDAQAHVSLDPPFDDGRLAQAGFRADWAENLTVQGDVYQGRMGQSVNIAAFNPPAQATNHHPSHIQGRNLMLRWTHATPAGSLQLQTYYDHTKFENPNLGESRTTWDVDFLHRLPARHRHAVTWGLNTRVSPSLVTQVVPTLSVNPLKHTSHVYSVFAQDELTLVHQRLWLTVGSKLDHTNYVGLQAQPTARLVWTPRARHSVWAAITRAVRTPSRLERDIDLSGYIGVVNGVPVFLRINGNETFNSERLLGQEAGYRTVIFGQMFLTVSAFHNQYNDLASLGDPTIELIQNVTPRLRFIFPYANGVSAVSNGLELAPEIPLAPWWRVKGSYAFLDINATVQAGSIDANDRVSFYEGASPRHQARVTSQFTVAPIEVDATARYVSALPALLVKPYVTFDARLGWQFHPLLRLSIVGQNLAQDTHIEDPHDPGPAVGIRRSIYASLTIGK